MNVWINATCILLISLLAVTPTTAQPNRSTINQNTGVAGTIHIKEIPGRVVRSQSAASIDPSGKQQTSPSLSSLRFISTSLAENADQAVISSLLVGVDGLPLIGHHDQSNRLVKIAKCQTVTCSSQIQTIVDTTTAGGASIAMAMGSDGLPIMSYQPFGSALKVARCLTTSCTQIFTTTVDATTAGPPNTPAPIAIGTDQLPVISYIDVHEFDLKVAKCITISCTDAVITTIDQGDVRGVLSMAIGDDGLPIVSYFDADAQGLKVAKCLTLTCTSVITTIVDRTGRVGTTSALAIGADGLPIISYRDDDKSRLKFAKCLTVSCTTAISTTVDTSFGVGTTSAIAVDFNGLPIIAYRDDFNDKLKLLMCRTADCATVEHYTVDRGGIAPSLAIGIDGLPMVTHYVSGDLKFAKALKVLRFALPVLAN